MLQTCNQLPVEITVEAPTEIYVPMCKKPKPHWLISSPPPCTPPSIFWKRPILHCEVMMNDAGAVWDFSSAVRVRSIT